MKILGLDLGSNTGWALGDAGARPFFGSWKLPKTGNDVGSYLLHFHDLLRLFLLKHEPDVVAFEAPLYLLHTGRKGESKTQPITARKLFGLAGEAERTIAQLSRRGMAVRCFEAHQQSWKKHFCGFANFGKSRKPYPPIETCNARGLEVSSTDEADAVGILDYTSHKVAPEQARNSDPLALRFGW